MAQTPRRSVPRPEYPRPQFVREDWLCLNGRWEFEIDPGDSGLQRGLLKRKLGDSITVPFCPESSLSGIGHTDFMRAVWYRRQVKIPKAWSGRRVLLHLQAADYDTTVWLDGQEVGRHRGGWCGFTCDLGELAGPSVTIVIRCRDDMSKAGPQGKQSRGFQNAGCHYTRTTGIWQKVWLEPVPHAHLQRPRITPDVPNGQFIVEQPVAGAHAGLKLKVTLKDSKGTVCTVTTPADQMVARAVLPIPAARRKLWAPGDAHLYDLSLELIDAQGKVVDKATSYAGLRSIAIDGRRVLINGHCVFQRLVLDQGYYADGIMTAPTDQALVDDIKLSMDAGFNGARLHQKVFEERFLYHADRLGYLCWGEFGDWGMDHDRPQAAYITQWLEVLARDYSHPCIVGWCGLNETSRVIEDGIDGLADLTAGFFLAAKASDPTRPVLDASGYSHRVRQSDVYDSHDYDQNPASFAERHSKTAAGQPYVNKPWQAGRQHETISLPYAGQPCFVSEFGGIWWNPDAKPGKDSWGYGDRCKSVEEFYARFEGLCAALLKNPAMFGYCYTQLTDVFQEQNGIYRFDRRRKFDMKRIRSAQQKPAAIENAS
jgi:beta-galactosidase/beta-glucuronidase